jgi:hypothetical protein
VCLQRFNERYPDLKDESSIIVEEKLPATISQLVDINTNILRGGVGGNFAEALKSY